MVGVWAASKIIKPRMESVNLATLAGSGQSAGPKGIGQRSLDVGIIPGVVPLNNGLPVKHLLKFQASVSEPASNWRVGELVPVEKGLPATAGRT